MAMEPDRARALLLEQHDLLRWLFAEALGLARRALAGEEVGDALEVRLTALRRAFAEHNDSEALLVIPILRLDPAWGPARIDRMKEEHAAEHAAFVEAFTGPALEVAARLADILEDLDAHMCAEERTFLAPAVLQRG